MTFEEFVKQSKADPDTVQQALRLYVSEVTDDKTSDTIRAELRAAAKDAAELEKDLKTLEGNSVLLEQAALAYFACAWEDPTRQPSIRAAFEHAKAKLPIIEAGLIALVSMYGMYLIATGGVTKETHRESSKGVREHIIEREAFLPIGGLIVKLFGFGTPERK